MNTTSDPSARPIAVSARLFGKPQRVLWLLLLLIALAELITSLISLPLGMASHALLLGAMVIYSAVGAASAERRLALALTLAPLIRLLSLALPLIHLPHMSWYPAVAVPLMLTTWLITRQLRIAPGDMGIRTGNLGLQLMLVGGGLGLGFLEYAILKPEPLLATYTWSQFTIAALTLLVSTGFVEEIIFRGVLQSVALPALGRWALLYVSLLFAALHIGYISVVDVVFVFVVGLLFAYIVRWSGSLVGVSLAHGLTNITLFLVLPYLSNNPELNAQLVPWLIGGGSAVAVVGVYILMLRSMLSRAAAAPQAAAGDGLRTLRRNAGITYVDLAQRTGLPVRLLAEIEHGMSRPQPEQIRLITQALGTA